MSYKLKYTGEQIDNILDRAVEGGTIDDALALKAPLESPALTGTPTAPTQAEGDDSTKVATTAYADRAADAAEAASEAAAKEYTDAATSALYITDTASGSIASFSDGADGVAMRSVKVAVTPVQSGSGDPSPDNVRPISGWTGATIPVTGKNLLSITSGTETVRGLVFTPNPSNGSISIVGTTQTGATYKLINNSINLKPNTTYSMFIFGATNPRLRIREFDSENNIVATTRTDSSTGKTTFTTQSNTVRADAYLQYDGSSGTSLDITVEPIVLLGSVSEATFEPYAGQTYSVTWESQAGEVFGGYFAVNSDGSVDLTVTHGIVDLGTLTWTSISGNFKAAVSGMMVATVAGVDSDLTCSALAEYTTAYNNSASADNSVWRYVGTPHVIAKAASYADAAAFKTAMTGQMLAYPLAQPVTYQLTPPIEQITSLLGQNNVWSNTGDVEVEYVADPKLYIAKMLGGGALTLGSASPLSLNRPVTINEKDLEQAGEVNETVEAAAETVQPAESSETEEGAQE